MVKGEFSEIILKQISWEENRKADELARMASISTSCTTQDTIVQVKIRTQINLADDMGIPHAWPSKLAVRHYNISGEGRASTQGL